LACANTPVLVFANVRVYMPPHMYSTRANIAHASFSNDISS